jgi:predicted metal-binding membrane protein
MSESATLPLLLLRERVIILLAIAGVTALSWLYVVELWRAMPDISAVTSMAMPMAPRWTPAAFTLTFAMWAVMMVGMMLPSAAPMILTFAALNRRKARASERVVPVLLFACGYLLAWTAFSLLATLLQWALDRLALLSPMLTTTNALVGGALFLAAGAYQLTPLKQACLRHCRSPFAFLFNSWRDGASGVLRMGIEHGAYCLGCCWLLMALLFVVGVMNLLWVAAIMLFVFGEKLLRGCAWIARISGVAMAAYGIWLVAQA